MVTFTASNLVIPRPPNLPLPVAEVTIIDDDSMFMISSYKCRSALANSKQVLVLADDFKFYTKFVIDM